MRRPFASINFVTAHDGFTMRDLVSYNEKHNEANGENNADGESHNRSWNCGVEGPTDDLDVLALRERQQRNFLTTLLLSQGVPMMMHGDEMSRTQNGNNNAYCQDNELTWLDWSHVKEHWTLLEFAQMVDKLRQDHPVFHRRRFFRGRPIRGSSDGELSDIAWFRPDGSLMTSQDWEVGYARAVAMFLNGAAISEPDPRGQRIVDASFLLIFNASPEDLEFGMPPDKYGSVWEVIIDTAAPYAADRRRVKSGGTQLAEARSVQVLRREL